jgi:hypothetical protein
MVFVDDGADVLLLFVPDSSVARSLHCSRCQHRRRGFSSFDLVTSSNRVNNPQIGSSARRADWCIPHCEALRK